MLMKQKSQPVIPKLMVTHSQDGNSIRVLENSVRYKEACQNTYMSPWSSHHRTALCQYFVDQPESLPHKKMDED
jgi:hypothetical protein